MLILPSYKDLIPLMKKVSAIFIGANLLFSPAVRASPTIKDRRYFNCQSDKKITLLDQNSTSAPEFLALVTDSNDSDARVNFSVKKNYILKNHLKTQILVNEKSAIETASTYLTVQSDNWALAIAPEKNRASLYNMNPDFNEVPMFCLSKK
jgi:hypothetical protein